MSRCKLPRPLIAGLAPSANRPTFYHDTDQPGLAVRVSGATRAYVVEGRPKGTGRTVRVTLGRCDRITLEQARDLARMRLGEMAAGVDPNAAERAKRVATACFMASYSVLSTRYPGLRTSSRRPRAKPRRRPSPER